MNKPNYFFVAKNDKAVTLYLYGEIYRYGDNDAKRWSIIITELAAKYQEIHLHVHSDGGDVFEGLAIFNLIKDSKATFIGYVDGIAASMASIVILACDKVIMHKNSFLMIHVASGSIYGNAKEMRKVADLLDTISDQLFKNYEDRNPESAAKFKELQDGEDHWLTPEQALEYGLIDEILDKRSTIEDMAAVGNITQLRAQLGKFNYSIPDDTVPKNQQSNKPKNKKQMNLNASTITAINAAGGFSFTAETDANQIATSMAAKLVDLNNRLEVANKEKETAFKARVKSALDTAVNDQKINTKQREQFEALSQTEEGFATVEAMISEMKPQMGLNDMLQTKSKTDGAGGAKASKDWTWDDYQEKDPAALEAMETSDPKKFQALFEAKYK